MPTSLLNISLQTDSEGVTGSGKDGGAEGLWVFVVLLGVCGDASFSGLVEVMWGLIMNYHLILL